MKAAATLFPCTTRTLQNYRAEGCPGFHADGSIDLALVRPWVEARLAERKGSLGTKEEKLLEEIRKLRIANDAKEGRLIERAWVAGKIQAAAGELNKYRSKSESVHPKNFAEAANDMAKCRTILRGVWDEIFAAVGKLSAHLEEPKS